MRACATHWRLLLEMLMDAGHATKHMLLWRPVEVEFSFEICLLFVVRTAALLCYCSTALYLIGALIVAVPCAPALIFYS